MLAITIFYFQNIYTLHRQVTIFTSRCTRCFVYPEPLFFSVHGQKKRRKRAVSHTRTFVLKPDRTEEQDGGCLVNFPFSDSSAEILVQWGLGNLHFLTSLLG